MNKFYKISLFLIVFISLSTYTPRQFQSITKNEKSYFDIENIELNGNLLIKEEKIIKKLKNISKNNLTENQLKKIFQTVFDFSKIEQNNE